MQRRSRLTLDYLPAYAPTPQELYKQIVTSEGWNYKRAETAEFMHTRDKALVAILYLLALRVSEAIRLCKHQFSDPREDPRGKYIQVSDILLSKRKKGRKEYNTIELPLEGERAPLTKLVTDYLDLIEQPDRLFPWSLRETKTPIIGPNQYYIGKGGKQYQRYSVRLMGTTRAWKIVKAILPEITEHWLRAFGEDYTYDLSGKDVIATAAKYKIDPRTLANSYLKRRAKKLPIR